MKAECSPIGLYQMPVLSQTAPLPELMWAKLSVPRWAYLSLQPSPSVTPSAPLYARQSSPLAGLMPVPQLSERLSVPSAPLSVMPSAPLQV